MLTSSEMSWTLESPSVEGEKTVYVQIQDVAGNTTLLSSSIYLDLNDPVFTTDFISPEINNQHLFNFDLNLEADNEDASDYVVTVYQNYNDCNWARFYEPQPTTVQRLQQFVLWMPSTAADGVHDFTFV